MRRRALFNSLIVFVLLLAAASRIIGATSFSLWTDEGWTWWYVQEGNLLLTLEKLLENRHPPLYFAIVSVWQNFAGDSHLALRFVAIAAGVITTAQVYRIAADSFNRYAGLYAAAIFSVLDIAVYYTQEVRHYSWLALMVTTVMLLFLRYLQRPTRRRWIAYSISVTGLMLTHYFGLFVMILQALFGLFVWRGTLRQKRNLVGAWIFSVMLYAPWLVVVFMTLSRITRGVGGFPGSFQSTYADLITMLSLFSGGQIALLGGLYLAALLHLHKTRFAQRYLIAAGIGLFGVLFILNSQVGVLSSRMIYFLTPALVIVCGYGFTLLPRRIGVMLVSVFVLAQLTTMPIIQPRANHRGAALELARHYSPGDLVVLELGWTDFALQYEIHQLVDGAEGNTFSTVWFWAPERILSNTVERLADEERVWVIQWLHAPVILPRMEDGSLGYELAYSTEVENTEPTVNAENPILLRLYQKVDTRDEALVYGENISLEDAHLGDTYRAGDTLHLDLWWMAQDVPELDYSVGLFVMDAADQVIVQGDAPLSDRPATSWLANELVHGRHNLPLPDDLPAGRYHIKAVVYWYNDPNNPLLVNGDILAEVASFVVD